MDNRISFSGISNVIGSTSISEGKKVANLSFTLTDKISNDLSEFKDVLKKFPIRGKDDIITLEQAWGFDVENNLNSKVLILNGQVIDLNSFNMFIFDKLAKLMNKIANKSTPLGVDEDFVKKLVEFTMKRTSGIKSEKTAEMIVRGHFLDEVALRKTAAGINKDIDEIMREYFSD